jgi:hypothetical protein
MMGVPELVWDMRCRGQTKKHPKGGQTEQLSTAKQGREGGREGGRKESPEQAPTASATQERAGAEADETWHYDNPSAHTAQPSPLGQQHLHPTTPVHTLPSHNPCDSNTYTLRQLHYTQRTWSAANRPMVTLAPCHGGTSTTMRVWDQDTTGQDTLRPPWLNRYTAPVDSGPKLSPIKVMSWPP